MGSEIPTDTGVKTFTSGSFSYLSDHFAVPSFRSTTKEHETNQAGSSMEEAAKTNLHTDSNSLDKVEGGLDSKTNSIDLLSGDRQESLSFFRKLAEIGKAFSSSLELPQLSIQFAPEQNSGIFAQQECDEPPAAKEGEEPAVPQTAVPADGWYVEPTSERDLVHAKIKKAGIEPKTPGITIGVIESEFKPGSHGDQVGAIINNPDFGLIPGARLSEIKHADKVSGLDSSDYVGKPGGLDDYLTVGGCNALATTTAQLEKILDERDPSLKVINMSFGFSNTNAYRGVFNLLSSQPEGHKEWLTELIGAEKAQQFINLQQADRHDVRLDRELMQAIVNRVDKVFESAPKIKETLENYQKFTEKAAERGVVLVVGAGNWQDDMDGFQGVVTKPGNAFNWNCKSDYVIAVGGTDTRSTPGDTKDDVVAGFSSHGDERYHPTVLTQGCHLPSKERTENGGVTGTSFATPQVAATVALMMAQNPKMSFQEIKQTLIDNSAKMPKVNRAAQGAGILSPDGAIISARKAGLDKS